MKKFAGIINSCNFAPQFGNGLKLHIKVDLVAQPVEHLTFNQRVPGSSPGQITKTLQSLDNLCIIKRFFYAFYVEIRPFYSK